MDDEIKGEGNSVNYKYRMHDPRVGRFFAVDPLSPEYPHNSPYAFSENDVIASVELEGLEKVPANEIWDLGDMFITVTKATTLQVNLTGEFKVASVHGNQVSLYKINSGPNKGSYLGIRHNHGTYSNFDPSAQRNNTKEGYNWSAQYVVGADRVPEKAFSGDLGALACATYGDSWVSSNPRKYSMVYQAAGWANFGEYGYYDENTGEFVPTKSGFDGMKEMWSDPLNFIHSPIKIKTSPGARNWNGFQKQTKGTYTLDNYPGKTMKEINKIKSADYTKWQKMDVEIDIPSTNGENSKDSE